MKKLFRHKPTIVEAIQYTGDNIDEIIEFLGNSFTTYDEGVTIDDQPFIKFMDVERGHTIVLFYTDYIVKENTEYYSCLQSKFESAFIETNY